MPKLGQCTVEMVCIITLKVKGLDTYILPLNTNMTSSGLQFEAAYCPAMTLGGAAQVAAAHCPNERTLDPAVCSYNRPTYAPASQPHYGLHPAKMFFGNDSLFLVTSITR